MFTVDKVLFVLITRFGNSKLSGMHFTFLYCQINDVEFEVLGSVGVFSNTAFIVL